MAEHIITVTTDNFDTMLSKAVAMARSGLAVGFNLSNLDAGKRLFFINTFNSQATEGSGARRSARIA